MSKSKSKGEPEAVSKVRKLLKNTVSHNCSIGLQTLFDTFKIPVEEKDLL